MHGWRNTIRRRHPARGSGVWSRPGGPLCRSGDRRSKPAGHQVAWGSGSGSSRHSSCPAGCAGGRAHGRSLPLGPAPPTSGGRPSHCCTHGWRNTIRQRHPVRGGDVVGEEAEALRGTHPLVLLDEVRNVPALLVGNEPASRRTWRRNPDPVAAGVSGASLGR